MQTVEVLILTYFRNSEVSEVLCNELECLTPPHVSPNIVSADSLGEIFFCFHFNEIFSAESLFVISQVEIRVL